MSAARQGAAGSIWDLAGELEVAGADVDREAAVAGAGVDTGAELVGSETRCVPPPQPAATAARSIADASEIFMLPCPSSAMFAILRAAGLDHVASV
ncbi:MAG TPA: hypothetical protein VE693_10555 [Gaiellaceae bacterium]|jgi:hypothetical protein|nr:hypothetical protein [Gaiellaceae bacterium]